MWSDATNPQLQLSPSVSDIPDASLVAPALEPDFADASFPRGPHALLVVDANVAHVEELLAQVAPGVAVLHLTHDGDALTQITQAIADYTALDSLHIVSHGRSGGVQLGQHWLTASALDRYRAELQQWGTALRPGGDILLYGCNVAADDLGRAFIAELSALTTADVAASNDLTGQGGDWDLEVHMGAIETELALTQPATYSGTLATFTVTNTSDSGPGSLRDAITQANNTVGDDTITFSLGTGPQTITLSSALPELTDTVAIANSTGAINLTIDGVNDSFDIFQVEVGAIASFDGLTISNGENGIVNNGGSITSINNSIVFGNEEDGIFNNGGTITSINNSLIFGNGDGGIDNLNGSIINIGDSTIFGNSNGIVNAAGTIETISYNTISDNSNNGILNNTGSTIDTISYTNVFDNAVHGIENAESTINTISYSNIIDNTLNGIDNLLSTVDSISYSAFSNNGRDGMAARASTINTISHSTFSNNGSNGMNHGNRGEIDTISYSTFSNNGRNGIDVLGSPINTISHSTFFDNAGDGLGNAVDTINTISNSTFSNNGGDGIDNLSGTINSIINNTFYGNAGDGIYSFVSDTGTLSSNLILGNLGFNISLLSGSVANSNNNLVGHSGNPDVTGLTLSASDFTPTVGLSAILDTTLADNGGPTRTHALVAGSPAIDASGVGATPVDQRGVAAVGTRDVGAFEFEPPLPEINVQGNNTDILDGDAAPEIADGTDFGRIAATGGMVSRTFTIQNTGEGALNLGANAVTLSGNHASDFTVTQQPAATVAPGDSTTFTIQFAPPVAGRRTAEIRIANDDSDESPYTFAIQGVRASVPNDFNGNGQPEILWRNAVTGENALWFMNGSDRADTAFLPSLPDPNWQIVDTADFDQDGRADILWRNPLTGQNALWFMQGSTRRDSAFLPSVVGAAWQIVDAGDFDGNGTQEILWRNAVTGENALWFMEGAVRTSFAFLPSVVGSAWQIADTGDFDGDGKLDLLWRNAVTGENALWFMNGALRTSFAFLPSVVGSSWQITDTGDFDGDGKLDILWRNTVTGENALWFMDGATRTSFAFLLGVPDVSWQIV